jgi:hypothetical protein
MSVRFHDERTTTITPGVSATPDFVGKPIILDEGLDEKYSPFGRPVRWRIERRGTRRVRCSTFILSQEEIAGIPDRRLADSLASLESAVELTLEILLPPPFEPFENVASRAKEGPTTVRLTEEDYARAMQLTDLAAAERWVRSSSTDPTLKSIFWIGPELPICARCRRTAREVGGLFHLGPEPERAVPEVHFALCRSCAGKLNRPAKLGKFFSRVALLIEGALRRN